MKTYLNAELGRYARLKVKKKTLGNVGGLFSANPKMMCGRT